MQHVHERADVAVVLVLSLGRVCHPNRIPAEQLDAHLPLQPSCPLAMLGVARIPAIARLLR